MPAKSGITLGWVGELVLAALGKCSLSQSPPNVPRGVVLYTCAALLFLALTGATARSERVGRALRPIGQRLGKRVLPLVGPILQRVTTDLTPAIGQLHQHQIRATLIAASVVLTLLVLDRLPQRSAATGYWDVFVLWLLSSGLY